MILHTFTLTLGSTRPIHGTAPELAGFSLPSLPSTPNSTSTTRTHSSTRNRSSRSKMINNVPTVIGINEGAEVLKKIYDEYQEIRLGANTYQIVERGIALKDEEFGISDKIRSYEFATPWLALSQENYKRFYTLKGKEERDEFVRKILIGNIISMSKSLGYEILAQIKCDTDLHFQKDRLKDVSVMTFTGKFLVNFLIPDYLGLGKSVSRGFGAVKQRTWENEKD